MLAATSMDDGLLMVGIADTKALDLAVFCRDILERCMSTWSENMRLRSECLTKAHHLVIVFKMSGSFPLTKLQTSIMSASFLSI